MILSVPFCPYHFVRTILFPTILSVPFCPRTPQSHSIVFSCSFTYPSLSLICPMLMLAHRSRSVTEADLYGHLVVAIGHFQMMPTTDQRLGYFARLQSPYLNTTGQCAELFYWMDASVDEAVLSIIIISEEKMEQVVAETIGQPVPGWNRLFAAALPSGVYQIVIEGRRGSLSSTGLGVDDIIVQRCDKFGKEYFFFARLTPFLISLS